MTKAERRSNRFAVRLVLGLTALQLAGRRWGRVLYVEGPKTKASIPCRSDRDVVR